MLAFGPDARGAGRTRSPLRLPWGLFRSGEPYVEPRGEPLREPKEATECGRAEGRKGRSSVVSSNAEGVELPEPETGKDAFVKEELDCPSPPPSYMNETGRMLCRYEAGVAIGF